MNKSSSLLRCPYRFAALLVLGGATLLQSRQANAADVGMFGILKGQGFIQTNGSPAVPDGPSNVVFRAFVSAQGPDAVTNASIKTPASSVMALDNGGGGEDFEAVAFFSSVANLDVQFPNGTYAILMGTVHDGKRTNNVAINGNSYPASVHFSNFSAAQAIEPATNFVLAWDPIPGATSNDFVQVQISDCLQQTLFETGSPGKPGALNGTNTSYLIPARTLRPGQRYQAQVLVARFVTWDTNSYAGATGLGAYFSQVQMPLVTTGSPLPCPLGRLELNFGYPTFSLNGATQGMVNFPQGLAYYFALFNLEDPNFSNPPETVTFSGPAGSGLNNTTNLYGGPNQFGAYYSSPSLNTPPFPPGGVYSIDFGGTNAPFALLDPNAANQQVLMVPTLFLDGSGMLTQIQWVYKSTNGATLGAQPFMAGIEIRIDGPPGRIYEAGNQREDAILPAVTAHVLTPPVAWTNVDLIQLVIHDVAGNSFASFWQNTPAPLQLVSSNVPPGTLGSPYNTTLVASGGVAPYFWSLDSGMLPPGLTFSAGSGHLGGSPTNAGSFNFSIRVTDAASNFVTRGYAIVVTPPNTPPSISDIPSQTTTQNVATAAIPFTVGDAETSLGSLSLSGASSDQSLVHNSSILFGGSGANRTVTVTPEPNHSGTTTITITVGDGFVTASDSFSLVVEGNGPTVGSQPQIDSFVLIKGQGFVQTNAGPVFSDGPSNIMFRSWVSVNGDTSLTNVQLQFPSGSTLDLPKADREFVVETAFASVTALDAAYPNGTYAFLLATANEGTKTNTLSLTGNSYPATPHLSNFAAAQAVDPAADFQLTWDAIPGATTNDFILVEIRNCQDREEFSTPSPGRPGLLNGTRTSAVIPARALRPGQIYQLQLLVGRPTQLDTNAIPGALGLAGYFKRVTATLVTLGPLAGCPLGSLAFEFRFRPGGFLGTEGATSYPQGLQGYAVYFSVEKDSNPPPFITFTGPGGSGLNHTTNLFSSLGYEYGNYYGSPQLPTPPFPPGGPYIIDYGGKLSTNFVFDPNAVAQQVLVVPSVSTNGAGELTGISWSYRDTNGAVLPPQPFMRSVRVRLSDHDGPLWPTDEQEHEMPPITTNVFISPPIPWPNLGSAQLTFTDWAGNQFISEWYAVTPEVTIATPALPGGVLSNAYSHFVHAFGGAPPYVWAIPAGSLPPGIQLDPNSGKLHGTPTTLGLYSFTLRAMGTNSQFADHAFMLPISPDGPDAQTYVVAKGRRFQQTNANPPVATVPGYQFVSFVEQQAPGRVAGATINLPGGLVRTLTNDFDRLAFEQSFLSQSALDSAFSNGLYAFTITAANDGIQSSSLLLTDNAYPPAPRIANWSPGQAIEASAEFVLSWNPFTGGTSNDLIIVNVLAPGGQELFNTPGYLEPEFLDGTRTSVVVPPHTLAPASPHKARLLFVKRTAVDTTSYPGVPGLAAYFAETLFDLTTLNPAGLLQFNAAAYLAGESGGGADLTVERVGGNSGTVTVDFDAVGVSAGTNDFVAASGTLTFGPGITSQGISIVFLDDAVPEAVEVIELTLSNVTGGASLGDPVATLMIDDDDVPEGPSVRQFVVAKGQGFVQTNALAPVADIEQPFRFSAFADEAFPQGLVGAQLRTPSNGTNDLAEREDEGHFEGEQVFPTKAALDALFKSGPYTFTLNTLNAGVFSPTIALPADAYPTTPHVANWAAAQMLNAFADFRLTWDAFAGGSTVDYIQLSIHDANTGNEIFRTPELRAPGALNGTNTSAEIPGGTLAPGTIYRGQLLFANVAVVNTGDIPGAFGGGGYVKQTRFTLGTSTPPPPQGQLQFAEPVQLVSETNGVAIVNLVRNGGSQGNVAVTVSTTNGTATSGSDYTSASLSVNFVDGQTNATFTFPLLDDSTYEGPESVKLSLSSPSGGATLAGQTNMVVTIVDNELPPTPGTLQFNPAVYNAAEAAGTVTLTVTRTGGSLGEVSVDYSTVAGSASPDEDFEAMSGTLVFPSGVTSRTLALAIYNDALDETNENFQVTLSSPANGASLGAQTTARVIILDNDTAGALSFSAAAYSINETGAVAEITVKRTGLAGGVTVDYAAVSGTATEGDDFEATSGTLTFDEGETEAVIVLFVLDDVLPEGNEALALSLSNPVGGATLGALTNAALMIVDDEVVVQFTRTSFTNAEATPLVTFTVTRSGSVAEEVTVDYATADETALAGEDYGETNGTIVFAAGVTSRTFTVPVLNDTTAEESETFSVSLSNPSGTAQLGLRDTATVLILDNDQGGMIAFSATNYLVKESALFALVTVTRAAGKASDVTVDFEVRDGIGTAEFNSDYVSTNGTLVFGANVTKLTFAVPLKEDALVEGNETVALRLSNPTGGATLGPRSDATITILDNDVAGSIRFSGTTYNVSETGTVATVTVLRSGGKAAVSVDYATADGTATAGADYTSGTGTLSFAANETTKTFTVPVLGDSVADGNETVLLSLRNPGGGAKLLAPTNAVLNILDDELSVQFSSATYIVSEGVASMALTVVRAGPSTSAFTVQYATADGTATAGSDYTTKTGTLTFSPTSTSQTISILLKNDIAIEGLENFTVTLSNPSGAAQLGARSTATVTITDNDGSAAHARR